MPVDPKDNVDLIEQARKTILETMMSKYDPASAEYKKCVDALKVLSDINGAWETRENSRLNDNAKNDIEEQKLIVEAQKAENDKVKMIIKTCEDILWFTSGAIAGPIAMYNMDETKQAWKPMSKIIERVNDRLIKP